MKALIYTPDNRLCQVTDQDFPVAHEFMWVDCDADVLPETHDYQDGAFVLKPEIVLSNFYSQFAATTWSKISPVLSKEYVGLEIAPFNKNGKLLGIELLRVYTVDGAPIGTSMLSIKTWAKDCQDAGVSAFTWLAPTYGVTLEEFTGLFEKLGFVKIISANDGNYMAMIAANE
jgi:hypothetical protein